MDASPSQSACTIEVVGDQAHECHVGMRTSCSGAGTQAFLQALSNCFVFDRFDPGGDLDPEVYTPVFLHDTLMLPGSLAQLIGKVFGHDIPSASTFL